LIPSLLPGEKPDTLTAQVWPAFALSGEYEINRVYRFDFIPNGFFSRLLVRLLQRFYTYESEQAIFWKTGLVLIRAEDKLSAQMYISELLGPTIEVFVRGSAFEHISQVFCAIIESLSLLFREWTNLTVAQSVLCQHCRHQGHDNPCDFPIPALIKALRNKDNTVECVRVQGGTQPLDSDSLLPQYSRRPSVAAANQPPPPNPAAPPSIDPITGQPVVLSPQQAFMAEQLAKVQADLALALGQTNSNPGVVTESGSVKTNVPLELLVPDLKLVYLKGNLVHWSELEIEKQIGRGGFAIVYKGTYKGEVVAIKKLEVKSPAADDENGDDEMYTKAFNEFRKEAFVMTNISSPYCVALRGVCLDPFALITEFIPCGDVYGLVNKPQDYELDWPLKLKVRFSNNLLFLRDLCHIISPKEHNLAMLNFIV